MVIRTTDKPGTEPQPNPEEREETTTHGKKEDSSSDLYSVGAERREEMRKGATTRESLDGR